MAFNPIKKTEEIQEKYFDFFKSSFALNNPQLMEKFEEFRNREYLWKTPYISVTQQFRKGGLFDEFVNANDLSPLLKEGFNIKELYLHQRYAIKNILTENNTIVASATGSGKTEVFLIPILDYCIKSEDIKGVKAFIVYLMNALANDQVERIRRILYSVNKRLKRKITFASYTGNTPESIRDLEAISETCPLYEKERERLGCPQCDKKQLYIETEGNNAFLICKRNPKVKVEYQLLTREEIRDNPPDILITNYVQLEYLLLREKDSPLFSSKSVKYVVFDEIHSYLGARGVDVALLIGRLRRRLAQDEKMIHIGTSATISTKEEPRKRKEEIAKFAEKLFGSEVKSSDVFEGEVEPWIFKEPSELKRLEELEEIGDLEDENKFLRLCKKINPNYENEIRSMKGGIKKIFLGRLLMTNLFFQELIKLLEKPRSLQELVDYILHDEKIKNIVEEFDGQPQKLKDVIWSYLKIASIAAHPYLSTEEEPVPLIRVNVHNFLKTIEDLYICNKNPDHVFSSPKDKCDICGGAVDKLGVCRFCGTEFVISNVLKENVIKLIDRPRKNKVLSTIGESSEDVRIEKHSYNEEGKNIVQLWQTYSPTDKGKLMKKCPSCGSISTPDDENCFFCESSELKEIYIVAVENPRQIRRTIETQPLHCPFCNHRYGPNFSALSSITMSSNTASSTFFELSYTSLPEEVRKLLIFTDNRQAASYLAGYMEDEHLTHIIRALLYQLVSEEFDGYVEYWNLKKEAMDRIRDWYGGDFEGFELREWDVSRKIDEELTSVTGRQRSIENLGLVEMNYNSLESLNIFEAKLKSGNIRTPIKVNSKEELDNLRLYLISVLNILRNDGAFKGLERANEGKYPVVGYIPAEKKEEVKRGRSTVIVLKGFFSPRGKIFEFTQKVFKLKDKEKAKEIIEFAFSFLERNNLLLKRTLQKWKRRAEGYIVNSSKLIIKNPKEVWKCNRCYGIYTNPCNGACLTWRCKGQLQKIDYEDFVRENKNYYFWLYKKSRPVRMVTQEDTGALDLTDRRKIEMEFKSRNIEERKVDVIVATPTLELGVDIGDLPSVGLFKAPPSPANYLQRVGRAGREEGVSLNNTFLFLLPIDMYYFGKPEELIKGEVRPPFLDPGNKHLLKRHIYALILEDLLVFSPKAHLYPNLMYDFLDYADVIKADFRERIEIISKKIRDTFPSLTDSEIKNYIDRFEIDLKESINEFKSEIKRYKSYIEVLEEKYRGSSRREAELFDKRIRNIRRYLIKLEKEQDLLSHFMNTGVLPRYAFPGVLVHLEEQFGEEFGGRSRNIAITECCPGMEIYLKKHIYEVIGIDRNFTKPTPKTFYICSNCKKYIKEGSFDFCPLCNKKIRSEEYYCIAPELILLRRTNKPINEPREYQEAISDIFLSNKPKKQNKIDNFLLSIYGNIDITQIVSGIETEDETEPIPIELCNECGRFRERLSENGHKILGGNRRCSGRFERINLFHIMPTNVISIKIISDSLFGVSLSREKIYEFLVTLKNAIINAAQIVVQAEDGEIEGKVKGDELILYDNVEGGVGYVDEIYKKFKEILKQSADMVLREKERFGEECEKGCLKCLWSYRRKRDIKYIDKRLIIPVLQVIDIEYGKEEIFGEKIDEIKEYRGRDIRTIHSPPLEFSGIVELKDILRSAQGEIKLTSLYVTDGEIDWPDEGKKSWVEILTSIRQSPKNVKISVIVKEPTSQLHKKALRRLIEAGIDVKVFKKEVEEKFPSIVHSKLIVVDQKNPSNRYAIHTSANFSPEMWKNHETFDFGNDEEWVRGTYGEIMKIERESRPLTKQDIQVLEGMESFILEPGTHIEELQKLGHELSNADNEVLIMDPYLTNVNKIFQFLIQKTHKGIEVKILTARTDSKKLKVNLEKLRLQGYSIEVLRYFDKEKITGQETILHDRYVIIDQKKVIEIGKGLSTFIEAKDYKSRSNVIAKIIHSPDEVKKYLTNFTDFWNYEKSKKH